MTLAALALGLAVLLAVWVIGLLMERLTDRAHPQPEDRAADEAAGVSDLR